MAQESFDEWADTERTETDAERCLSFTIRGPWAHFRRIEGNIVKQTYRIVPRTTVAGLVAAVLGIERDGYYDLFTPESSAIAIEPVEPVRTMNLPMNTLSTADEHMQSLNSRGKVSVKLPDPVNPRQQHNYEVLVDPAYRVDLWLANGEVYSELRQRLVEGKSHYPPSLGISEHLAEIDYHGEFEIRDGPTGTVQFDSVVPAAADRVVPQTGVRYQMEQSPAFMQADQRGRTTTGFTAYTYNPDAGPVTVSEANASVVDERTVLFV